jgi:hypothetical protein
VAKHANPQQLFSHSTRAQSLKQTIRFENFTRFKFLCLLNLTNFTKCKHSTFLRYLGLQAKLLKPDGKSMLNTNSNSSNLFDLNRIKLLNLGGKLDLRKSCRNDRIFTTPAQRNICLRNEKVVTIMARAAKLAIDECQSQFKFKRWNCSVYDRLNVFGNIINTSN